MARKSFWQSDLESLIRAEKKPKTGLQNTTGNEVMFDVANGFDVRLVQVISGVKMVRDVPE